MEVSFYKVGNSYKSEVVELSGSVFGLHLEFAGKDNKIAIYRSCGGDKFVCAKEIPYVGNVFDGTFTDGLSGMNIIIRCNNEPDTAVILE